MRLFVSASLMTAPPCIRSSPWSRRSLGGFARRASTPGSGRVSLVRVDFFAWIVLIVLLASTVFVIVFMAMLPGMIATRRTHPWAKAVPVAGWVTLFFGFVLWPVALIWAYVDVPERAPGSDRP